MVSAQSATTDRPGRSKPRVRDVTVITAAGDAIGRKGDPLSCVYLRLVRRDIDVRIEADRQRRAVGDSDNLRVESDATATIIDIDRDCIFARGETSRVECRAGTFTGQLASGARPLIKQRVAVRDLIPWSSAPPYHRRRPLWRLAQRQPGPVKLRPH